MNISKARETRIFLPFGKPFSDKDWAERIFGEIILPFTRKFEGKLEWFWFIRLYAPHDKDKGNCDFDSLPEKCFDSKEWHRSVKFRFRLNRDSRKAEKFLRDRVKKTGCVITDIRSYSVIDDLASSRFAPKRLSPQRKIERAKLITGYFHILSRIVLDSLVKKNGRWAVEKCLHRFNYFGTIFESLLHLFCIITPVKTAVFSVKKGSEKAITAPMEFVFMSKDGWRKLKEHPVKM